jgi:DNA repair exonuclease SbcCD ATPase subunit|nr:MAG TPA: chromosome partition protein [Caudoviricetes sp.]
MRTIKLKSLSLFNFKGIRNLTLDFTNAETWIYGENGTGKTTVCDAFSWLLFGKDSKGRSDSNFNIKTLDESGKPILKIEHYVSGLLSVDGKTVKLQRRYVEKWSKPRGTTEETLKNHQTEFYVNDVKLATKQEYDSTVASILPEDVSRMITNPFYFTSLNPDVQKSMLLDMAGDVTDEDVAGLKPEYVELLAQLSGKSLAQYSKEIAARKKAIKDELVLIPSNIETANRLKPEEEDWVALDAELTEKRTKKAELEATLSDKSKLVEEEYKRKANIQKSIGEKRISLTKKENELRATADKGRNDVSLKIRDMEYKLKLQEGDLVRMRNEISSYEEQIQRMNTELDTLRGQYRQISQEQLTYPDGAFVCPTCHRQLEADDIAAKQHEMEANFNQSKSARLQANSKKGKGIKATLEETKKKREDALAKVAELEAMIEQIKADIEAQKASMPESVDVRQLIESDADCIVIRNEISELENQLTMEAKTVDTTELKDGIKVLDSSISELVKRLAKREAIERADKEIETLEEKRISNNQALADLEKTEFVMLDFQKAKDNELMKRINGMFQLVSFSFVNEQLNGGEKLTCVCTIDGVPYPDLNDAKKLNAGLDIINAMCKVKGISAPIFIDNRERVNEIIPTISQIINLVVSHDKELTIK